MISACLIGVNCRYDGGHSTCSDLLDFVANVSFIPFCPEQLGGLPTPRSPAIIKGGDGREVLDGKARLINSAGEDVTDAFIRGAKEAYSLARLSGSRLAIMKDRSPSCGLVTPYAETPRGYGIGVTAALFISRGIRIFELGRDDSFPNRNFFALLDEDVIVKKDSDNSVERTSCRLQAQDLRNNSTAP